MLELTADTFHESTVDGANIIKFYDPTCGHCNELAPTWKNLASQLAGGIVRVSRVSGLLVDRSLRTEILER